MEFNFTIYAITNPLIHLIYFKLLCVPVYFSLMHGNVEIKDKLRRNYGAFFLISKICGELIFGRFCLLNF